jgi:hypothetical protein
VQSLKPSMSDELHLWIAMRMPYPQMKQKMLDSWGFAITSPAVTYHRQHFSAHIAMLRARLEADTQRRERDRRARRRIYAGHIPPGAA